MIIFKLGYFNLIKFFFVSLSVVLGLFYLCRTIVPFFITTKKGFLKKNYNFNKKKKSAYECGFEPFNDSRGAFEVHFHITAILFLLFDVEVAFLLPWVLNLQSLSPVGLLFGFAFFLILLFGFAYELFRGALEWPINRLNLSKK